MDIANLVAQYETAAEEVQEAGALWYFQARREAQRIGRETGIPWHRVAAAIAVLSPLQPWEKNLEMAETLATAISRDDRIPEPQTFGLNWSKAIEVLHGEPILEHVKGPKVTAFYFAICGDDSRAVVDSWMCKLLGWEKGAPKPGKVYDHLAAFIHAAAREVNVSVTEFQATLWVQVRDYGEDLAAAA